MSCKLFGDQVYTSLENIGMEINSKQCKTLKLAGKLEKSSRISRNEPNERFLQLETIRN